MRPVPRRASLVALPAAALAAALVPWPPALVERAFSAGLYAALQPRLTALTNGVPIAILDLLLAAGLVAAAAGARASWRRHPRIAWRFAEASARAVRAAAALYLVFLGVWGLNYRRVPAPERFAVDAAAVSTARLRVLIGRAVEEVNRLAATPRRGARLEWLEVEADLRTPFAEATHASGTRWTVEPGRPKASLVARTFPLAAVDGMVNPFGLEVLVNPEVLPFERPFVLAHEWAHLAGHADESEASFVGLLACLRGAAEAQYSAWQSLLVHAVRGVPADERRAALERLTPAAREDLRAVAARLRRAQPWVHAVSWRVYDRYLRANRVAAGLTSYDEVTRLVLGSPLAASIATPSGPAAAGRQ